MVVSIKTLRADVRSGIAEEAVVNLAREAESEVEVNNIVAFTTVVVKKTALAVRVVTCHTSGAISADIESCCASCTDIPLSCGTSIAVGDLAERLADKSENSPSSYAFRTGSS